MSVVFFDESVFFFDAYRHCKINNICTFATDELIKIFKQEPLNIEENELIKLFEDIKVFRDELELEFNIQLPELSMGMSNDFELAIQQGATMIRIGRKLFK